MMICTFAIFQYRTDIWAVHKTINVYTVDGLHKCVQIFTVLLCCLSACLWKMWKDKIDIRERERESEREREINFCSIIVTQHCFIFLFFIALKKTNRTSTNRTSTNRTAKIMFSNRFPSSAIGQTNPTLTLLVEPLLPCGAGLDA